MIIPKRNIWEGEKLDVTYPLGIDIFRIIGGKPDSAHQMTCVLTRVGVGVTVEPCHSHRDLEEVVFVLSGEGKAWVDGKITSFRKDDLVSFPPNSKHMVRNLGDTILDLLCFFPVPDYRKEGLYHVHEDVRFEAK